MSISDKLTTIAENQQQVYDSGIEQGKKEVEQNNANLSESLSVALTSGGSNTEGLETNVAQAKADIENILNVFNEYEKPVAVGQPSSTYPRLIVELVTEKQEQCRQAVVAEFWNSYQSNGNRTDYARAFEGSFWNDDRFKPEHSVNNAQNCNFMFHCTNIKDLSSLNIGYCTGAYALCREAANLELMGNIYLAGNTSISQGFYSCSKLTKIGVLRVGTGTNLELAFYNCTALKEVTFTGTIGTNLDIGKSPLNRASIDSIIGCLSDTATGKTLTLQKAAKEAAFADEEWSAIAASKKNWTISLV